MRRIFQDRVLHILCVLRSTKIVISNLTAHGQRLRKSHNQSFECKEMPDVMHQLTELKSQLDVDQMHFSSLFIRIREGNRLVAIFRFCIGYNFIADPYQLTNILELLSRSILRENGFTMSSMAERAVHSSQENVKLLDVSTMTKEDSNAMRVAALLALAYIPPSFLAVSLL